MGFKPFYFISPELNLFRHADLLFPAHLCSFSGKPAK
jgi:hypothetical protein